MSREEDQLRREIEELQRNLGVDHKFRDSLFTLRSLLRDRYPSASSSIQNQLYSAVCRVATVLKTRYTAVRYWYAGLEVFEEAEKVVNETWEKEFLRNCIREAYQHLTHDSNNLAAPSSSTSGGCTGYLFGGHLTMDPEPPQPMQAVLQNHENLLTASTSSREQEGNRIDLESITYLLEELVNNFDEHINRENVPRVLEELVNNFDSILSQIMDHPRFSKAPPASKEVVAKLPLISVTKETLIKLGHDAECAICQENLVENDQMLELPCKHVFHPPCLKPWLDDHNSCPICRDELPTDDHAYERWKERQK